MVTSGYQMLFLLSGNESLGVQSNLLGEEPLDIYQQTSEMFYKHIKHNYDFIQLFFNKILKTNIIFDETSNTEIESQDSLEVLKSFFLMKDNDLDQKCSSDVWLMFEKIRSNPEIENFSFRLNIDPFVWLMKPQDVSLVNSTKHHTFNQMILILRRQYHLVQILNRNPWLDKYKVLQKRGLFKQIIMIELYGGTRNGREKAYKDFIKNTCMELGIIQDYLHEDLKYFFYYVNNFYVLFKNHYLKEVTHLVALAKLIAKKETIIKINNPNFNCIIANLTTVKRGKRRTMRVLKGIKPYQIDLYGYKV